MMTPTQAAKHWSVSTETIRRWRLSGVIPRAAIGRRNGRPTINVAKAEEHWASSREPGRPRQLIRETRS